MTNTYQRIIIQHFCSPMNNGFLIASWVQTSFLLTSRLTSSLLIYPLVISHSYWKWHFFMGKSTIAMASFNSYVSHCQRVSINNGYFPTKILKPPFIRDFPWLCNKLPEGNSKCSCPSSFHIRAPEHVPALLPSARRPPEGSTCRR